MDHTPETDAQLIPDVKHSNDDGDSIYSDCVPAELARKLETERNELLDATRNLKLTKGRHSTQVAADRLFNLLPEAQ